MNATNDNGKKNPIKPHEMAKIEVKNFASPKPPIWRPGARQIANLATLGLPDRQFDNFGSTYQIFSQFIRFFVG